MDTEVKNPWDGEPNAMGWKDPATGLRCVILRNRVGALCGYVQVLRHHPLYGKKSSSRRFYALDVHGGVTFAKAMSHRRYMKRGYWIGFDCAHCNDLVPALIRWTKNGQYRDIAYVKGQVEQLAAQVRRARK